MNDNKQKNHDIEELKDEQLDAVQGGAGIRTISDTKKGFTARGGFAKESGELTNDKKAIAAESGDGSI